MATVTYTLTTAFTVMLFVFFVVSMYEKVNIELFQQYKGVIFAGSAFMVLGLLGLPYMEYDVATQSPSFQMVTTAVGIMTVFGALFVYLLNMQFDTYIVYISAAIMIMTIYSRVTKDATDANFPPFARDMLIYLLAVSFVFGLMKLSEKWQPADVTLQRVLLLFAQLGPIVLWGMLAYVIYLCIRELVSVRSQKTCNVKKGRVARFEGYQDAGVSPEPPGPPTLNEQMQSAIDRLQNNLDLLVDMTDSTCSIIREVEQGYIGSRSAPANENEVALPQEEQDRRRKERQGRAEKSFAEIRKIYASTRGVPLLECFQVSEEDVTLRELCIQLHGMLDNAETLVQIRKVQSMEVELAFADRLLKKTEGFTSAPTTSVPLPQLYAGMSGAILKSAATTLLQRELKVHNDIVQVQSTIQRIEAQIGKSMKKANMVATGDYNATSQQNLESDIRISTITKRIGE